MSKEKDVKKGGGPEPGSVLMGLTVAWNMYGFASGFFERAWKDAPIPVTPISYALNAAIAVFAPITRSGKGWTTRISTTLGVLMAAWSAVGVFFIFDEDTEMIPRVPAVAGPGVAAALGVLISVFGLRTRRE